MDYFPHYHPAYQYGHFSQAQYPAHSNIQYPTSSQAEAWRRHAMMHHGARATESKPRLAKDEVDKLEREFQRNHKPNSSLKKQLAEEMRVDIARINNWFQNRRAKAKQEKRTQENDAQRKSEQDTESPDQDTVKEYYPDDGLHDDLRPSAAPFPSFAKSTTRTPADLAQSFNHEHIKHENDDNDDSSAISDNASHQEQLIPNIASIDHTYFPTESSCDYTDISTSHASIEQVPSHLTLAIPSSFASAVQEGSVEDTFTFDSLSAGDMASLESMSTMYSAGTLEGVGKLETGEYTQEDFAKFDQLSPDSTSSPNSTTPSLSFKPPPIDIASRRNTKRPAQLGLGCMRSYSFGHPGIKTGLDASRRMDMPSPMRRVVSATGTMPRGIQKPNSGTPRSPMFFERNQDLLLQMASQTPTVPGIGYSAAPPTPDTPMINNQQARELTVSSASSEDGRYRLQSDLTVPNFGLDPTLRTPPDTPGLLGDFNNAMFTNNHLQTTFDYTVSDEPLITPGLGSFETEFPTLSTGVPSYVSQSCASQPSTPSYPPTNIGPAFFPSYSGGNLEYGWSDAAIKSSPGQMSRSRQFQFTNMTAQDFHGE